MKLKNSILAIALAVSMLGSAACAIMPGNKDNGSDKDQSQNQTHKVTLHLYDDKVEEKSFDDGERYSLPTPEREGYIFNGWFTDSSFTGSAYAEINPSDATADKEFWAKWTKKAGTVDDGETQEYSVTLNLGGGSIDGSTADKVIKFTQDYTLPTPVREGYKFDGWYTEQTGGYQVLNVTSADSGKTFYARWTPISATATYYTVTIDYNYESGDKINREVESGQKLSKIQDPSREGYKFLGWFNAKTGGEKFDFDTPISGNITIYAHWQAETYTVTWHNTEGATVSTGTLFTSYEYGSEVTLPTLNKDGNTFDGWYDNAQFTGEKITKIEKGSKGDKNFYAKFTPVSSAKSINVTASGGYEEGAYLEFDLLNNTKIDDYTVEYAINGTANWTEIDSELIREISSGKARADIVGVSRGTYDLRVKSNDYSTIKSGIVIARYDRSGYAHFNKTDGVGAYKDDGTPKTDAQIVYVTEENKNSDFKVGGKTYNGVVKLIQASSSINKPLIIRMIGTIGAATWQKIDYNENKEYNSNNKLPKSSVVGLNSKALPDAMDETAIVNGGYNKLDVSTYTKLNNLTNEIRDDKGYYDSYFNMCDVSAAKNVTIEGIGTDAVIDQWGFTWKKCNSIEVRNLTFNNYPEDACSFEGATDKTNIEQFDSRYIWLHNCEFNEGKNNWDVSGEQDKHEGDGSTDFKGVANVTVSYIHYYNNHKTGLVGGGDGHYSANLTFHHNFYDECWSRLPLGRQANMHMYNNYYKAGENTSYFTSLRANAFMFAENCYYDTTAKKANLVDTYKESEVSSDKLPGYAKLYNCIFEGKVTSLSQIDQNWAVGKYFKVVTNRTDTVSAQNSQSCKFGQNFDTDPDKFYYDSDAKKTSTQYEYPIIETNQVKTQIPSMAGVHKNK